MHYTEHQKPVEEHRSTGEGTGLETERTEDPQHLVGRITDPFDPEQIEVNTKNITASLILSRMEEDEINLAPDFQRRRGIWTETSQSRLIESLLLKIPLPTFYAAENEDESWEVIDGIQRLSTVVRFMQPDLLSEAPLTLRGLEYLNYLEGANFDSLPSRLKRRLRETEFVVHLIRHSTPEPVKYNIFARINTGGTALSAQELRHALVPGNARTLLGEWAQLEQFKEATDYSIRDERMADREMVLRFIAFNLTPPERYERADLDLFLKDAMSQLNNLSRPKVANLRQKFQFAMAASQRIFGNDAFRKRYDKNHNRYPINKALFEAVSVALGRRSEEDIQKLERESERVRDGLMRAFADRDFERAISQGTGDPAKVRRRFQRVDQVLDEVLDDHRNSPE